MNGRRVLISCGPMRTSVDSVRFLQNRSSGWVGLTLADELTKRGAQVTVLLGPVEKAMAERFSKFRLFRYEGVNEYRRYIERLFPESDVFLSVAAVLDFEVIPYDGKIEREKLQDLNELSFRIRAVPDFVAWAAQHKKENQKVIAFAAEKGTQNEILQRARKKMEKKGVDAMVANPVWQGLGPESESNLLWILRPGLPDVEIPLAPKTEQAAPLVDLLFSNWT